MRSNDFDVSVGFQEGQTATALVELLLTQLAATDFGAMTTAPIDDAVVAAVNGVATAAAAPSHPETALAGCAPAKPMDLAVVDDQEPPEKQGLQYRIQAARSP